MTHAIHRPPALTMAMTNTHTKTKTKAKTKCLKDPTYNIFEKQGFQGPDQTREDFNFADLILELALWFYFLASQDQTRLVTPF